MHNFFIYLRLIKISLLAQMEYRLSFILQSSSQFLLLSAEFAAVWILFVRFRHIRGWHLFHICVFYGLISISFSICDALTCGFDKMPLLIRKGDLDRYLLRPCNLIWQILGYELSLRRIGRFSQGLLVLLIGFHNLSLEWTVIKGFIIILAVIGSVCLFSGILFIQGTISFWTTESLEIMNTLTYGGIEAGQFPITIYTPAFQKFFTYAVPLACVNYFPVVFILDKKDILGTSRMFQALSPCFGLLFLLAGILFFYYGIRHYTSTGT